MAKDFKYVAVITGVVRGRNRANAYLQAAMGVNLSVRLLSTPHDIAIEVEELEDQETSGDNGRPSEHTPPFESPLEQEGDDARE